MNMTKEELEKEAEEIYTKTDKEFMDCQDEGEIFNLGYLAGAEPREKRISELEAQIAGLKEGVAVGSTFNKGLNSLNKALEEERDKYRNMVFDKGERLTKAKAIMNIAVEGIVGGTERPFTAQAEKLFNLFLDEVEKFMKEN